MNLSALLMSIISKIDGERTIYAGFHLLRGKKSGQTLQDVEYYGLKKFFGLLPKLSTEVFDEAVAQLKNDEFIRVDESLLVYLTESGQAENNKLPVYNFNGWDYRGKEMIFFARLSLTVQTISNFRADSKNFYPTQKDTEIQTFVKTVLHKQLIGDASFSKDFQKELVELMVKSDMHDVQKVIFTHRLVGYNSLGWTWAQLGEALNLSPMTVKLYFIESLHMLLDTIEASNTTPFTKKLAVHIKVSSHLTDSSMKTKVLFQQGYAMEEIMTMRQLKMSTIEDHFVEMVINDELFPIEQFVSVEECESVYQKSQELKTKRLRLLKDFFPTLSYFQLRLILGRAPKGVNDEHPIRT